MTPKNPHCMHIMWKKAAGPVTGYRVYCFPGDSLKAEIIKDIDGGNTESAFISGLKPETTYRVGVTSVSSGTESKQVFCDHQLMRKFIMNFTTCKLLPVWIGYWSKIYQTLYGVIQYKLFWCFSWNPPLNLGPEFKGSKKRLGDW